MAEDYVLLVILTLLQMKAAPLNCFTQYHAALRQVLDLTMY